MDDIAGDYHNLGTLWRLDKCCRAHDFCPVKVSLRFAHAQLKMEGLLLGSKLN